MLCIVPNTVLVHLPNTLMLVIFPDYYEASLQSNTLLLGAVFFLLPLPLLENAVQVRDKGLGSRKRLRCHPQRSIAYRRACALLLLATLLPLLLVAIRGPVSVILRGNIICTVCGAIIACHLLLTALS